MHTEDMVIKQRGAEPKAKEIPNKHQPYLIMHFLTRIPMICGISGGELRRRACVGHQICARHCERSFTKVISCVPANSPVRQVITFYVLHEATERALVRPRGWQLMYSSQQKVRECWYLSFVTFHGGLLPGAGTWDPTHDKVMREKTWRARQIRFSGIPKSCPQRSP